MAESTWEAIVARIVDRMQTIADIGLVYDSLKLAFDKEAWLAAAVANVGGQDKARMWTVRLEALNAKAADQSSMQWDRQAVIEGYLQIESGGATEKLAIALTEKIIRTLWNDLRLTKLNNTVLWGKPPQLLSNTPQFFGFVAAHYIRLVMPLGTIEQ